jgi:RNA polymerase sigma factor (sigma-70 family)
VDSERTRQFVTALEKTHGRSLRRFLATRMRHARPDVPDLVQEVYLRLLRIPDHEAIRNAQAYLYTIASHVLHQYALRQRVTDQVVDPTDIVSEVEASLETDPAERVQLEQRFAELGKGLEQLSSRAYATLMMVRCEGATFEEIGQRLGVSSRMAKKYMAKALSYCQQRLQETE